MQMQLSCFCNSMHLASKEPRLLKAPRQVLEPAGASSTAAHTTQAAGAAVELAVGSIARIPSHFRYQAVNTDTMDAIWKGEAPCPCRLSKARPACARRRGPDRLPA